MAKIPESVARFGRPAKVSPPLLPPLEMPLLSAPKAKASPKPQRPSTPAWSIPLPRSTLIVEEEEPDTIRLRSPTGGPVPRPVRPTGVEVLDAAFRQENVIVNALALFKSRPQPEPGYNPWDDIKGTDFEFEFADEFTYSQSRAETAQIKSKIEQERKDRELLASNGGYGMAAQVVAGLVDPTIFIPGGAIYRGIKGARTLRSAASVGAFTAGQATGSELVKQGAQATRTWEESIENIGTSTLLSPIGVTAQNEPTTGLTSDLQQLVTAGRQADAAELASQYARDRVDDIAARCLKAGLPPGAFVFPCVGDCLAPDIPDGTIAVGEPGGVIFPRSLALLRCDDTGLMMGKVYLGLSNNPEFARIMKIPHETGVLAVFWMANPENIIAIPLRRLLFLAPITGLVDESGLHRPVLGWSFERGEVEFVERFIEPLPLIGFGEVAFATVKTAL